MAKGHGKFICAALIGAAVGCGLAYLNKCRKEESWDEDFDDFQDEDPEDEKRLRLPENTLRFQKKRQKQ